MALETRATLSLSCGVLRNNESVVQVGADIQPEEFGSEGDNMEDGEWEAKADAGDLILSSQNGGGKPEVADRRVSSVALLTTGSFWAWVWVVDNSIPGRSSPSWGTEATNIPSCILMAMGPPALAGGAHQKMHL